MGSSWDAQSHEDRYSSGIPDMSYGIDGVNGWIELKQLPAYPDNGIIKHPKYTSQQVNWSVKRGKKGGHCFLLFKIRNDYYLFGWWHCREVRKGVSVEWARSNCIKMWKNSINKNEFKMLISS